jgi:hypothetical protein
MDIYKSTLNSIPAPYTGNVIPAHIINEFIPDQEDVCKITDNIKQLYISDKKQYHIKMNEIETLYINGHNDYSSKKQVKAGNSYYWMYQCRSCLGAYVYGSREIHKLSAYHCSNINKYN